MPVIFKQNDCLLLVVHFQLKSICNNLLSESLDDISQYMVLQLANLSFCLLALFLQCNELPQTGYTLSFPRSQIGLELAQLYQHMCQSLLAQDFNSLSYHNDQGVLFLQVLIISLIHLLIHHYMISSLTHFIFYLLVGVRQSLIVGQEHIFQLACFQLKAVPYLLKQWLLEMLPD